LMLRCLVRLNKITEVSSEVFNVRGELRESTIERRALTHDVKLGALEDVPTVLDPISTARYQNAMAREFTERRCLFSRHRCLALERLGRHARPLPWRGTAETDKRDLAESRRRALRSSWIFLDRVVRGEVDLERPANRMAL